VGYCLGSFIVERSGKMKIRKLVILSLALTISLLGAVACESKKENKSPEQTIKNEAVDTSALYEAYKDYFSIGVAVEPARLLSSDPHSEIVLKHFNTLVAENAMKPESLQPTEGNFNFKNADAIVDFAIKNNMKMRGHTLIWHSQIPDWFFKDPKDASKLASREVVLKRMENHITTVLKHFRDKYGDKNPIYCWDVVNEAVSDQKGLRGAAEKSLWIDTVGEDYIEKAFEYAHKADPNVKLYINDYNIERNSQKTMEMYDLVKSLKDKNIPIDGIGMQMHVNIKSSVIDIKSSIKKFKTLGVDLQITELDMDLMGDVSEASLKRQAELYKEIFKVLVEEKQGISNVTFWGISDEISWLKKPNSPLLFDSKLQPKPAYNAVIEAIKQL
jgi:endo-1,4-beta-xylanase